MCNLLVGLMTYNFNEHKHFLYIFHSYKVIGKYLIHIVDNVTDTANITMVCLTFRVEENAKELLNFT